MVAADEGSRRRDFLQYALSLMRAHNSEHSDALPVLDVAAMKHIAYVFDALVYYMRSGNEVLAASSQATPQDDPQVWPLPQFFSVCFV